MKIFRISILLSKRNTTDNKYGVNEGIVMTLIAKYGHQVQIHEMGNSDLDHAIQFYKPLKLEVKGSCIKLLRTISFCLFTRLREHTSQ